MVNASKTAKFGKLVRVDLTLDEKIIQNITITGDFFLHPEEKIEDIESGLVGANVGDRSDITRRVNSVLKDCEYYGFDTNSLVQLIHSFSTER